MHLNQQQLYHLDDTEKLLANATVSLSRWQRQDGVLEDTGVRLSIDDDFTNINDIVQIPFIVLDFANFEDGRIYSKLNILRNSIGFKGKVGAINAHLDHLQLMARSGVDWFQLASEYDEVDIEKYVNPNSVCYQHASNNRGLIERFKL